MNIRDIARLANVTPGTVSKVLNNYPDISEATRQHVLQIIKENQYTTKNGGRKFKQAVTPRIGLVSENVYNWVSETMQNLLSVRFHNADYTVLSFQDNYFSQNKNEKFQELLTYIDRHQLTGLIYFGGNFEDVPADSFAALNCPVIFVNTVLPPDNMMTGSAWDLMSKGCRHYGVNAKTIKVDEDTFKERLDEGNLIVVNVGPGDFTDNGHFMVITGYDDEGFTINDPNSIIKSNTHWQFERLSSQIRAAWRMFV